MEIELISVLPSSGKLFLAKQFFIYFVYHKEFQGKCLHSFFFKLSKVSDDIRDTSAASGNVAMS